MGERLRLMPVIARALFELTLARWQWAWITPEKIKRRNGRVQGASSGPLPQHREPAIERIAYVVPRIAVRLPWRSDCLIQALAVQRWLSRSGVTSHIVVGARLDEVGDLLAHAWLQAGDWIIIGGDVSSYEALIDLDFSGS